MVFLPNLYSLIYAQIISPGKSDNVTAQNTTTLKKPYGVRITSPANGEVIFVNGTNYFNKYGERLLIEGSSISEMNSNSSKCSVSLIVNGVRPYQLTNATGEDGPDDYSKWVYIFNTKYLPLEVGSNKLTAKLTCQPGNINAFYSVNVTGIKSNGTFLDRSVAPVLGINNVQVDVPPNISSLDVTSANVLIHSPKNGEQVKIDQPFTVSGSSKYPSNWDCEVSIADGNMSSLIVPNSVNSTSYKQATAIGNNGTSDYSTWQFTVNPAQTNLKNGSQSITAKLQCDSPASLVKTNKVNVIGILSKQLEPRSMDVTIDKQGDGSNQDIIITVKNSETNQTLSGANISGTINDNSFSGSTNSVGELKEDLTSELIGSSREIDVSATVVSDGYKTKKVTTSFSLPTEEPNQSNPPVNRQDENDVAEKIISDVQKQLNKQGINIPIPFG